MGELGTSYSGVHLEDQQRKRYVGLCDLEEEEGKKGQQAWGQVEWGVKEIEAPTLAKRSLPSKGSGQAGTTRKEGVSKISLKIQVSGGV